MTGQNERTETGWSPSRREVLGAVGAAGSVSIAGCGILGGDDEETVADDTITVGVSVPQEGRLSDEGDQLLDGYRLAVEHINNGGGAIADSPWADDINEGILGENVELITENTGSTGDGAETSARTLVNEGIDLLTGGASAEEGLRHQVVAAEEETLYLGGYTPANNLGGSACTNVAFNEMYNPAMAANALVSTLDAALDHGGDLTFAQLYPNTESGRNLSLTFRSAFEGLGWSHAERYRTREGTRDFSGAAGNALGTGSDLYVLNYSGLAAANAVRELVNQSDGDIIVVVPFLHREALANAGSALEGVYGTVPWTPALDDSFSQTFASAWDEGIAQNDTPTELAHLAYVQLCQFAAAAERAGSVETDAVVEELEGYQYDLGMGTQELRACDHQAMRGIPVVRGRSSAEQDPGSYADLVGVSDDAAYPCDELPASDCQL